MFWDRLLAETFVAQVEHRPVVNSTNELAKHYAAGRPDRLPLLIVADRQTAGRGRGSNRWWTGAGALACSLVLDLRGGKVRAGACRPGPSGPTWPGPDLSSAQEVPVRSSSPLISLATGLAVVRTVAPLLPGEPVGIHWPNDVFAAERKLSGILVEVLPEGLCVIGIGLNTNNTIQDAPDDVRQKAATLRDLTGREHDPTEILVSLLGHLESLLGQLATSPETIAAETDRLCLQRGQTLTLPWGRRTVSGLCLGVASDGGLILDTPEGKRTFYGGVPE
jgi:BirA family transcriptional regulator, biotin operon repressor / biotin---[acetyl-CoA-carboxylase] ligase